jgi:hypothetical protein
MITDLKNAEDHYRDASAEVERINALEKRSRQDLAEAKSGDLDSATVQKKFADARLRIDLCEARRAKAESAERQAREILIHTHDSTIEWYNSRVDAFIYAKEEESVRQNIGGFGDERETRRWLEGAKQTLPVFQRLRLAFYDAGDRALVLRDLLEASRRLRLHAGRWIKEIGLDEASLQSPHPTRPAPRDPFEGDDVRVKVRAVTDAIILDLDTPENRRKRERQLKVDEPSVKEGQVLEITTKQFRAWSRYFERVAALMILLQRVGRHEGLH